MQQIGAADNPDQLLLAKDRQPHGAMQSARQLGEKRALGEIMPVGLLDRAAGRTHRGMHLAGTVGALRAGARLGMLAHLSGVEVCMSCVADILQEKRLAAVAHDDPFSGLDVDLFHRAAPAGGRLHGYEAVIRDSIARLRSAILRELGSAMALACSRCPMVRDTVPMVRPRKSAMSWRDIGSETSSFPQPRAAISIRKEATRSCALLISSSMWSWARWSSRAVISHSSRATSASRAERASTALRLKTRMVASPIASADEACVSPASRPNMSPGR